MIFAPGTRIMMTTDTVGGVWVFSANLARALGAANFRVLVVTLGPKPTATQRAMISECPGLSLMETDLALEWQDPAGSDLGHARAVLAEIADGFAPHLVHLNGFREATFDWKVPTVVVAHSCVNSWAAACGETEPFSGDEWKIYSAAVGAGLRNADAWVAPTAMFRDQLMEQYALRAKGHVIWNGVDGVGRSSEPKLPVILSAGRLWDKAKNVSAIVSVASRIDWPVRIAGPCGVEGSGFPSTADGCEFLGEMPHEALLAEMKMASIFVSPAIYEPFGLSVLEAASAGCALLLSDIPTFRELWDGAALFFDPREPAAIERCLRSLSKDELLRTRLQRAASERARRYPLRNTVNAYRSLYESLLARACGRPVMIESGGMPA
jgi:glycosyltransferase involved in cell wall biosynthesis